ncbi:MAG: aminopeptidase P family protein [Hyphomicrobiales bacterium]|nr:aminopeptidase P family protein [Hyphomicrobiales bacterium]
MAPALPERLRPLLEAEYPRFSDAEMARRRQAVADVMAARGIDHLVFYGANWTGSAVQWLTHWPVSTECAGVFTPGRRDRMFIHYYNHLPLARRIASEADVDWGGPSTLANVVGELKARGARGGRIGLIGPLGHEGFAVLKKAFGKIVSLGREYVQLRKVKSQEELDWFRVGAWMSDCGMQAMADHAKPGVSEHELANAIERAYAGHGGQHVIHFIGSTPMADPSVPAPVQYTSSRKLQKGDIVFSEISAHYYGHSGQVLRSYAVGQEPTPLYRALHAAADAAFDAISSVLRAGAKARDVYEASRIIEDAGFETIDDVLHGYGGGYFPPVIGSTTRENPHNPDEEFVAGQLVVVQPNVVTSDGRAGVQTGEMLLITETGVERMHDLPRGFPVV